MACDRRTVYVVMQNDFPAAVYDDETKAQARCFREIAAEREARAKDGWATTRVHWNVYPVPLEDEQ